MEKRKRIATILTAALILSLGIYGLAAKAGPVVASQQQHQTPHRVQYTAKIICGYVASYQTDHPVVPGLYKTSVNVRNNTESDVFVDKHLSIVYSDNYASGREPLYVQDQWQDSITLNPHSTTMDDCERIYQLTGIPIGTFLEGYLEFNAFQNTARELPGLVVDAVYTAVSDQDPYLSPSIDVQRIPNDYVM